MLLVLFNCSSYKTNNLSLLISLRTKLCPRGARPTPLPLPLRVLPLPHMLAVPLANPSPRVNNSQPVAPVACGGPFPIQLVLFLLIL